MLPIAPPYEEDNRSGSVAQCVRALVDRPSHHRFLRKQWPVKDVITHEWTFALILARGGRCLPSWPACRRFSAHTVSCRLTRSFSSTGELGARARGTLSASRKAQCVLRGGEGDVESGL